MKSSRRNQQHSSKKRLYYVDNPNKKELSMLGSSPRVQGGFETPVSETVDPPDRALQVSGVGTVEVVAEPAQPAVPAAPDKELLEVPAAEETLQIEEVVVHAPEPVLPVLEKERLQPVYTDDLCDAAVTGQKIAPRTIDGSKLKFGIIGTPGCRIMRCRASISRTRR